jgi:hypothetical protein
MSRALYPRERDPVPIVQDVGFDPRTKLRGCEKISSPTGIISPDRPAWSESLLLIRLSQLYQFLNISNKHLERTYS